MKVSGEQVPEMFSKEVGQQTAYERDVSPSFIGFSRESRLLSSFVFRRKAQG
jgi:hypothetical protein